MKRQNRRVVHRGGADIGAAVGSLQQIGTGLPQSYTMSGPSGPLGACGPPGAAPQCGTPGQQCWAAISVEQDVLAGIAFAIVLRTDIYESFTPQFLQSHNAAGIHVFNQIQKSGLEYSDGDTFNEAYTADARDPLPFPGADMGPAAPYFDRQVALTITVTAGAAATVIFTMWGLALR